MNVFGSTRSSVRKDHALIAPDSFVGSALPGWDHTEVVIPISPQMGARFLQYLALMGPGASAAAAPPGFERVLYVLDGEVMLQAGPAVDVAVNLFTFKPGADLPLVEVHVMEHGLLMLEGQGVYRLADAWHPVQQGDVIWMAPYCPQWFVAMGKTPARYLYYKDVNRDPTQMRP